MKTATEKRVELRKLIERPGVAVLPGVYDGYSVRLVESMGFQAGNISGAGISNSRLARPDVGLMGLESNIEACRRLCAAVDIPLFADGDTGYGNAVSVYFATRAFEEAGVSGIFYEDQTWPKRCGHMDGKQVIDSSEMVAKVSAAVAARTDPQMVVMARTDAAATHGLEEAIARCNRYLEAGADMVFPDALRSEADIERLISSVDGPVCINMGFGIRKRATTPLVSPSALTQYGASLAFYARILSSSALMGMRHALNALKEQIDSGEVVDRSDLCVGFEEVEGLVGLDEIAELERRFDAVHLEASGS